VRVKALASTKGRHPLRLALVRIVAYAPKVGYRTD
jgi:hypothetical protein